VGGTTNRKEKRGGMNSINEFRGEYEFLSNFYERDIVVTFFPAFPGEYRTAPTNEHAFQACKTDDPDVATLILQAGNAKLAKQLGQSAKLLDVEDWNNKRVDVMEQINRLKYEQHLDLKLRLMGTGSRDLVEGNTWKDEFWGVSKKTGLGENHLGKILMKIRFDLFAKEGSVLQALQPIFEKHKIGFVGKDILALYNAVLSNHFTNDLDVLEVLEKFRPLGPS
jgi:ribA/ribD-fused uncharacterized protein